MWNILFSISITNLMLGGFVWHKMRRVISYDLLFDDEDVDFAFGVANLLFAIPVINIVTLYVYVKLMLLSENEMLKIYKANK